MTTLGYVLLSGGIDSSTALTFAIRQVGQRNVRCVSIDYGQRHLKEIHHAKMVANYYGRPHEMLSIEGMPKAMLTDSSVEIPNASYADLPHGISPTYVPFRNGQLLSKVAGHIQGLLQFQQNHKSTPELNSNHFDDAIIYFGAHAEDAANWAYPDCTPEFVGAMANAIFIGTYQKVRLVTPWLHSTKDEIITYGGMHGTPYYLTWSCYAGGTLHCGVCPTCRARKEAFEKAAVMPDPTEYASSPPTSEAA
jgi:7-cyano-7-deazaguanine synthase